MTRGNTRRCPRRNGPHRRRTRGRLPPERHPGAASTRRCEKSLGSQCARPGFFGWYGDRANPEKPEPHVLEESPNLRWAATQPCQLKDALRGLGHGADGLLLERLANQIAIAGHLADRAIGLPTPQAFQAIFSEGGHVA